MTWQSELSTDEIRLTMARISAELEMLADQIGEPSPVPAQPAEPTPDSVTLRAILAVLDLLDRPDVDPVARVALLVGEVRTLRESGRWAESGSR